MAAYFNVCKNNARPVVLTLPKEQMPDDPQEFMNQFIGRRDSEQTRVEMKERARDWLFHNENKIRMSKDGAETYVLLKHRLNMVCYLEIMGDDVLEEWCFPRNGFSDEYCVTVEFEERLRLRLGVKGDVI
jgi:hypothetical protein